MISYNPKHWFLFIFKIHKAETFRQLFPLMFLLGVYSFIVYLVFVNFLHVSPKGRMSNLSVMYSVLGFVISLLLVFRTNTAYERWWEGRKLWGSLVNSSRNLAIKLKTFLPSQSHSFFKQAIPDYSLALKIHLQNVPSHEHPNKQAGVILTEINKLFKEGKITEAQLIILNADWQQFTEICGACERIKNTPIPYSYSAFIKKFLFFYTMFMPFAYVSNLGYYVVPLVVFIFYVLASIELIAEEIENPFGDDDNDLPLDQLCDGIKKSVEEIFV
ncbi:MAG: bestrophin family protein [Bacteroidia bacterium]